MHHTLCQVSSGEPLIPSKYKDVFSRYGDFHYEAVMVSVKFAHNIAVSASDGFISLNNNNPPLLGVWSYDEVEENVEQFIPDVGIWV